MSEQSKLISKEDWKKLKKFLKSKKGKKAMDEVIEKCNQQFKTKELEEKSKKYQEALWWNRIKDIPFGLK